MTYGGYTSIQLLFSWTGMGEGGLEINNVYKTSTGYSTQLMRVRGEADRELATISVFQSFGFSSIFHQRPRTLNKTRMEDKHVGFRRVSEVLKKSIEDLHFIQNATPAAS